jgi:hypothetical protein
VFPWDHGSRTAPPFSKSQSKEVYAGGARWNDKPSSFIARAPSSLSPSLSNFLLTVQWFVPIVYVDPIGCTYVAC